MERQTELTSGKIFVGDEMGDRVFIHKYEPSGFGRVNLEYAFYIDHRGMLKLQRRSDILPASEDEFSYLANGRVLLKPLTDLSRPRNVDDWENYRVHIELKQTGKPTPIAKPAFSRVELGDLVEKYFPSMGITGQLDIISANPWPGDFSRANLGQIVNESILSASGFRQISNAHKAFLESFAGTYTAIEPNSGDKK